jgi:ABC-type sugar transport system ATPase subunit
LENAGVTVWQRLATRLGFLRRGRIEAAVVPAIRRLEVKSPSLDQTLGNLSGGNQQKVSVAKWLAAGVQVLIVDEPSIGIDIKTKAYLHQLLRDLVGHRHSDPAHHLRYARDDHARQIASPSWTASASAERSRTPAVTAR